jgi:hypothetical protein
MHSRAAAAARMGQVLRECVVRGGRAHLIRVRLSQSGHVWANLARDAKMFGVFAGAAAAGARSSAAAGSAAALLLMYARVRSRSLPRPHLPRAALSAGSRRAPMPMLDRAPRACISARPTLQGNKCVRGTECMMWGKRDGPSPATTRFTGSLLLFDAWIARQE